jgi:hypothetical protein
MIYVLFECSTPQLIIPMVQQNQNFGNGLSFGKPHPKNCDE